MAGTRRNPGTSLRPVRQGTGGSDPGPAADGIRPGRGPGQSAGPGAGQRDRADGQDATAASRPAGETAAGSTAGRLRMPPVRLAPREELAAAARVAPLLRAARDLARWAQDREPGGPASGDGSPADLAVAAAELDLAPDEVVVASRVAAAAGLLPDPVPGPGADPGPRTGPAGDVLAGSAERVLAAWDRALGCILAAEELDGLATALYTTGGPVRMDSLFEAYSAAAGPGRPRGRSRPGRPARAAPGPAGPAGPAPAAETDQAAALSAALETLADLAVVELGTDESAGGLTVALSPLGVWGVHRRLRAQGWHVPVLGGSDRSGAAALLATLASCDAEDGEIEIGSWLDAREPGRAAAELIEAARNGTPGLRGAAFAVLDRIGPAAAGVVREALAEPMLRAHAAVWLHEHGEQADLSAQDRTWLLVDLGAGLLEEADPRDVVAELLPELPPAVQAEIVAGLWQVSHPAVTSLLTALSDHHPDPGVARAARKAAFKARSPAAGEGASA